METSIKTGTQAIVSHRSGNQSPSQPNFKESFVARVEFVLYDDSDKERFNRYGGYEAIGTIECRVVLNNMLQAGPPVIARPLKSNDRFFPVVNEMVRIVPASSYQNQDPKSNYKISYYYDDIISTWDSPEHNAVPDHTFNNSQFAKRETYQESQQGVTNNSGDKNVSATGIRFKETGQVRKLLHSPGDRTIEGRTGNSIRMGSSNSTMKTPWTGTDNNPLLIIRNGQKITGGDAWLPVFEDIDKDGSSIYMLSGQNITFIPGNNNFDTYHQRVNVTPKSKYVEPKNDKLSVADDFPAEKIMDTPPVVYQTSNTNPVTGSSVIDDEIDFLPDNENQFFKETEDVPLTNGLLSSPNIDYSNKFDGGYNSTFRSTILVKSPSIKNINVISTFAGFVSSLPNISKNGQALIDLISLTEGTMGNGNFNGYDVIFGGYLFPGYNSYDSMLLHPNIIVNVRGLNSGATGRYQFLYSTWKGLGGFSMSKYNQDLGCWKLITQNVSVKDINNIDKDYESFKLVIDKISGVWASLPDIIHGIKGRYNQAGNFSFELLYNYYKLILKEYKN